jgi:hypothetical protein
MTTAEHQAEALDRARNGNTMTNYPAIFAGFIEKGIPEYDIKPRENVFTFHAWKALGRSVKKGEHGVKVVTFVDCAGRAEIDQATGEEKRPATAGRTSQQSSTFRRQNRRRSARRGNTIVHMRVATAAPITARSIMTVIPAMSIPLNSLRIAGTKRIEGGDHERS